MFRLLQYLLNIFVPRGNAKQYFYITSITLLKTSSHFLKLVTDSFNKVLIQKLMFFYNRLSYHFCVLFQDTLQRNIPFLKMRSIIFDVNSINGKVKDRTLKRKLKYQNFLFFSSTVRKVKTCVLRILICRQASKIKLISCECMLQHPSQICLMHLEVSALLSINIYLPM